MMIRHKSLRTFALSSVVLLLPTSVAIVAARPSYSAIEPSTSRRDGSIEIGGRMRTYFVHTPPAFDDKARLGLVIVVHGGGGNAANAEKMSGMSAKADQEKFLVAYPNGTGVFDERLLTWNTGNCCGYALEHKVDDVAFFRALIDKLERDYPVDPQRIYVTGMSNGGMMTYLAGCNLADKIAGIAPVAGAQNFPCHPSQPVSLIAFHGTADQHVPFEGGTGTKSISGPRVDKSVAYAIKFWVNQDGCPATPHHTETSALRSDLYAPCKNGAAVELNAVIGQGHAWPGGERGTRLSDEANHSISATDRMWTFFAQHPKQ